MNKAVGRDILSKEILYRNVKLNDERSPCWITVSDLGDKTPTYDASGTEYPCHTFFITVQLELVDYILANKDIYTTPESIEEYKKFRLDNLYDMFDIKIDKKNEY